LCGFAEEQTQVDEKLVKAAADELQWVEYSERVREQELHGSTGQFSETAGHPLARVEVLFRDEFVSELSLPFGAAVIGRTPENNLQIRSKFISRHHAQIVSDAEQSVLEDLNSTNGVFVKGKRVKNHALKDGDVIQLGEHKLLYRDLRRVLVPVADDDEDGDADDDEDRRDDLDDEESEEDGDAEPEKRDGGLAERASKT
jgi:pSer/pThr/pTyr-binding forkhead associated (FHA) protein